MLSIRARLIKFLLQNRHVLQLNFKQDTTDWSKYESVLKFRQQVENGAGRFGKLPVGIEVKPLSIDSISAEWLSPSGAPLDKAILYFHGGGYVSGTCNAHRAIVAKFVEGSGIKTLLFEYRLAPENPYPAAVEDSLTAYKWLLDQGYLPSNIALLGDSAGGGLALATLLAIRDQGIPLPAAAVAYSPVTDYACTGESYQTKARVCLSPRGMGPAFGKLYAGGADLTLPYISPLYGDLQGLPRLLIFVGEDETLLDDSIRFAYKAKAAGVDVTLNVGKGLFHCYPAMAPLFPEATEAMAEICAFLRKSVGLTSAK
ncbi:MAG: alpha/beta hydrolase [Ignavibacteriales bacterium]